jgi:hypothetical protein
MLPTCNSYCTSYWRACKQWRKWGYTQCVRPAAPPNRVPVSVVLMASTFVFILLSRLNLIPIAFPMQTLRRLLSWFSLVFKHRRFLVVYQSVRSSGCKLSKSTPKQYQYHSSISTIQNTSTSDHNFCSRCHMHISYKGLLIPYTPLPRFINFTFVTIMLDYSDRTVKDASHFVIIKYLS